MVASHGANSALHVLRGYRDGSQWPLSALFHAVDHLAFSSRRRTHTKVALPFAQATDDLRSLFLLYERVRDLFASVDGGDDDEEGAACDN